MSNAVTNRCRPLQMKPTPKCVLMALADRADDDGVAWPSISWLGEWTCFGRTTVIEALKVLSAEGLIAVTKKPGQTHRCVIDAERVQFLTDNPPENRASTRTGAAPEDHTAGILDPSGSRTGSAVEPVREPDGYPSESRTSTRPGAVPPRTGAVPDTSITSTKTPIRQERELVDESQQQGLEGLASPVVAELPLKTGLMHLVTQAEVDSWTPAFPTVNLPAELKRMRLWLDDKPARRKTKRGINDFILGWLGRAPSFAAAPDRAPQSLSRHTGFDQRNYEGEPDGSIPA